MHEKFVVTGIIVTAETLNKLLIINGFIAVENGQIVKKGTLDEFEKFDALGLWKSYNVITLSKDQLLMPGLIDCHVHGPQFPNLGLGLDKPLLEWLEKYTFPLEKMYDDVDFASTVYNQVVRRLLKNGTTTACYFGSIHVNGTLELAHSVIKYGQRALVGKVSMNIHNDMGYFNDLQTELIETESFVKQVQLLKNPLVEAIITPRFAVSCDCALMTGLSELAEKYNCKIQSHISENLGEIACVLDLNPDATSYAHVYDKSNMLNNKCVLAHGVHLTSEEIELLALRGSAVAHCPASNTRLMSGVCPLRKLLNRGITVGLGTDVSGGDNASIMDAMRRAMDVSAHLRMTQGHCSEEALTWKEAFYLATLGGAKALNLDHITGSFEVGKDFDALIVDVYNTGGNIDKYNYTITNNSEEYGEQLLQRFIYLGDDRNIVKVYVKGNEIKL